MDVNSDFFNESAYQVNDDISIPVYADVQTYPCSNCGRSFQAESLRKHQPICKKSAQKASRKVFDMGKQRATDSDVPYAATRETTKFYHEGTKPKSDHRKTQKNNWREDHQTLVRTIRQAREERHSIQIDSPPVKPSFSTQSSSDYIQCQFCQRHFNQYSAERHIPFCETQLKRKQAQQLTSQQQPRSPAVGLPRHPRLALPVHQINSAPSKSSPGTTNDKSFRRAAPPTFKRTANPLEGSKRGTPPRHVVQRPVRPAGNYLFGLMRAGRPKEAVSPQLQRRKTDVSSRVNEDEEKGNSLAKHCHQCGAAFPVPRAKFCCQCGERRLGLE